jgi:hypothetical protein
MTWLYLPKILVTILTFTGSLTISYFSAKLFLNLRYRIYHKRWPKNPEEFKYFLLLEENKKLQQKIKNLEEENAEMLNSIINNLKG